MKSDLIIAHFSPSLFSNNKYKENLLNSFMEILFSIRGSLNLCQISCWQNSAVQLEKSIGYMSRNLGS